MAHAPEDLERRLQAREQRIKSLEARLARAEQLSALGRLVAGAVHELNNPLTVVQGYAELLQEQPLPPTVIQRLQDIQEQARHAAAIVASLVRLSRSTPRDEDAEKPAHQRSCDLAEVIHETVAACARDLSARGVLVHVNADPSLFVAAEPSEVSLMLDGMLKDAAAALPSAGHKQLFVTAGRCGVNAEISVGDTVADTRVTLPALPDSQHPAQGGGSALIVAEGELARSLWQETLINQNWTAAAASNPADALRQLARDPFDVVLIDSSNPVHDGLPLRSEMDRRGWSTPLVLITGDQVDPASRQSIEESGCLWLSKPFRIAQLRTVLESTLQPA